MAEEMKTEEMKTEETGADEVDVIAQLKEEIKTLKDTTVSKDIYNKLKKAYAEGGSLSSSEDKEPTREEKQKELKETVIRLHENKGSNIEQEQDLLRFRELFMDLGGRDPFTPSDGAELSQEDTDAIERRVQLGKYAIEQSGGDSRSFSAILGSNLKDVPGIKVKK